MDTPTRDPPRESRLRPWVVLVLAGAIPLVALAFYARGLAGEAIEGQVAAANRSSAEMTCRLVERDFGHRVGTLETFARLPDVVAYAGARDEEAVRERLQVLVESDPHVDRAFVTDSEGLLWSDYPRAPESLGRHFAHRDWYEGISGSWRSYVSRVYRRHAEPQPALVAIATPIRETAHGDVIAALVYQVLLEDLTRSFQEVEVGDGGFVYLVDHAGVVAAHPRLGFQDRELTDYSRVSPVAEALQGEAQEIRGTDPSTGSAVLATAVPCEVGGHWWVVVAQQDAAAAYGPIRALRRQLAAGGLLLAVLVSGLFFGLARFHDRLRATNRELREVNQQLARENEQRLRAERELQESHDELEKRVEDRTRELRAKEEQLLHAQKMEAVGRLAGGIAHDFNNLLTVIIGYGDVVLGRMPPGASNREEIQEMWKAGELASSLTGKLLAFSRKQVLDPRILDLNRVVRDVDKMLQRVIGADVELVTRLDPELDPVRFDPGSIQQIVLNLAVNARDAMPSGGKLTIETANVTLDEEYVETHTDAQVGPHVLLAVSDSGTGMDEETKSKIFDPFFTSKELGRGTGLGLSTVYGIVKQAGGNIWVYSEPGHGSTFKIYLPAAAQEDEPAKPRKTEPAVPTGTETILVVEDAPGVLRLVASVLRSSGFTVLEASGADEALALAEHHEGDIHLLLTDVILPRLDGPTLADAITEHRPKTRVLFMSGYTDQTILHRGLLDHEAAFLEKPIRPATLLQAVRETLSGAETDRPPSRGPGDPAD